MVTAQTLVEYGGLLNSIAAALGNGRDRIELIVGPGNSKYLLLAVFAIVILFLAKRRRAR